jgi:hypothetical protein
LIVFRVNESQTHSWHYINESPSPGIIPKWKEYRRVLQHLERLQEVTGM